MASDKRMSRAEMLEQALFEALETPVPAKDVAASLDALKDEAAGSSTGGAASPSETASLFETGKKEGPGIELGPEEREKLARLKEIASGISGRELMEAEAVRLAIRLCPLDPEEIGRVLASQADDE